MLKITSDGLSVDDTDEAQVEAGSFFNLKDPDAARKAAELEERNRARAEHMSPPGALGLPFLLERRRLDYRITDGAFHCALISDRVWVKQIPEWSTGTAGRKSPIVLPDATRDKEFRETPMGILVAAGPKALDELRSNGVDLGHRVRFIKDAVFRTRVDRINGRDEWVLVLNAGDIIGSEDLQAQYLSGKSEIIPFQEKEGAAIIHLVRTPDGLRREPVKPWASPDYV